MTSNNITSIRPALLVRRLQQLRDTNAKLLDAKIYFDELSAIDKTAYREMMIHWHKTGQLTARFFSPHNLDK